MRETVYIESLSIAYNSKIKQPKRLFKGLICNF